MRSPLGLRPRSLTARLVLTAVGLVAVVCLLFATATALALRTYLDGQKDEQVKELAADPGYLRGSGDVGPGSGDGGPRPTAGGDADGDGDGPRDDSSFGGQGLLVVVLGDLAYQPQPGGGLVSLGQQTSAPYTEVPVDGRVHSLTTAEGSSYRVVAAPQRDGTVLVAGLRDDVDQTVIRLLPFMGLFVLLGTSAAAGAGLYLVRRQLQPLREVADTAHEVAALPLASGAVDIPARVPDRLTDERTEVGQVGSALNTLLGHVENALGARHRSEQQVRQFVADASHELRTPLATIQGYAELARRTHATEPEALLRALEKVEAEGVRMTSLVEDLLLLARLDAGRPLAHDEVDLTRLVLEAVSDARVVSPDHRWRLQLPDDPVIVPGDELRLRQVLVNLLSNAARHTPSGTTVTVTVGDGPGGTAPTPTVRVHDDGPGVPPSLQSSVFERFSRADTARTREVGGAGLGLSLARAIARAHGGDLELDSRPGSTTFTLTLPVAEVAEVADVASPEPAGGSASGSGSGSGSVRTSQVAPSPPTGRPATLVGRRPRDPGPSTEGTPPT